jgi:hypothetical protein
VRRRRGEKAQGRKGKGLVALLFALSGVVGCDASLPDPESPAAQLYQKRCATCHRLYAPSLLTTDMWRFMMGRMEIEMQRRGVPLLAPEERAMLLEYLQRHAGG